MHYVTVKETWTKQRALLAVVIVIRSEILPIQDVLFLVQRNGSSFELRWRHFDVLKFISRLAKYDTVNKGAYHMLHRSVYIFRPEDGVPWGKSSQQ